MLNGSLKQSEATAARRRIYLHLVDATDGLTPETGEAAGQPQISKNGGAWANTSATLTAIGNGRYYVELTAAELDTLGNVQVRYKSANTAEGIAGAQVVAFDPYDATRLGLSNLDAAVSGRASQASLDTVAGYVDTEVGAIKAKTDLIPASPAAAGDAMTLTAGERNSIADALLKRDWTAVTGEAARSVLNALRSLRNKVSISGGTITVRKEDDAASAWTAAVTTTPGDPISSVDPT